MSDTHPANPFATILRALPYDALRMTPREKMFALLLAWESFGTGAGHGFILPIQWWDVLSTWRLNEIRRMLEHFVRSAWATVDVAEGTFRLAPDRWPGWATVLDQLHAASTGRRQEPLDLQTAEDLNKAFAHISQRAACSLGVTPFAAAIFAKISHGAKISQSDPVQPRGRPPDGDPPKSADFAVNLADSDGAVHEHLRSRAAELIAFKKKHKGIKPLQEFESLKEALLTVETATDERDAYTAMCGILGGIVMEGGDLAPDGRERIGDGGKWRNRWRTSRAKTHRVLASLVEMIKERRVQSRGGEAERLWQEFSNATK